MSSRAFATIIRDQVQAVLAERVPAALTPFLRAEPECKPCGVRALDECLRGGLRVGAITELVGQECSGRTTMALPYVAAIVQSGNVAAWIDVDDVFDPESAAKSGVDCARLLWVRCGYSQQTSAEIPITACTQNQEAHSAGQPIPPGSGGSPHPRSEGQGMPQAISDLLLAQPRSGALPLRRRDRSIGTPGAPNRPLPRQAFDREEQVPTDRLPPRRGSQWARAVSSPRVLKPRPSGCGKENFAIRTQLALSSIVPDRNRSQDTQRSWTRLDQALRVTDLLLQSGGFSLIVLDLGSTAAEKSLRIPLTTWFRYRAACERTRASLLLITRHACAQSSAALVLRMETGRIEAEGNALKEFVFHSEVEKQRFQQPLSNVIPIRKPPQSERPGAWKGQAAWAI